MSRLIFTLFSSFLTLGLLALLYIWSVESTDSLRSREDLLALIDSSELTPQIYEIELKGRNEYTHGLYVPTPQSFAFGTFPIELLKTTELYGRTCSPQDFTKALQVAKSLTLSPNKLLIWYQAVCKNKPEIIIPWLQRKPFLHPSGASYAKLFSLQWKNHPKSADPNLKELFHIKERTSIKGFDLWFSRLSEKDQDSVLGNQDFLLLQNFAVRTFNRQADAGRVSIYSRNQIDDFLWKHQALKVTPKKAALSCPLFHFSFCFSKQPKTLTWYFKKWWVFLSWVFCLFLAISLFFIWFFRDRQKKKKLAEQARLFQVLSHETRTPLTQMKLSLEKIRDQFDHLEEAGQKSLLSLLESQNELERVVSKSLEEIHNTGSNPSPIDIEKMIRHLIFRKYEDLVRFETQCSQPIFSKMSSFWLEVCVSNLIKNALRHGKAPVVVRLSSSSDQARIEIEDQGEIELKKMRHFLKAFQKGDSSPGLGLGLSIVSQKMKEFKGARLELKSHPTRFILVVPRASENS